MVLISETVCSFFNKIFKESNFLEYFNATTGYKKHGGLALIFRITKL